MNETLTRASLVPGFRTVKQGLYKRLYWNIELLTRAENKNEINAQHQFSGWMEVHFRIYTILRYGRLYVCVRVCVFLSVCPQTPPKPIAGFTFFVGWYVKFPGWFSSTFRDLRSKVMFTRGHWNYCFLCSIVIEWSIVLKVLKLELPKLE